MGKPASKIRLLTPGEINLCKTVFDSHINYSKVTIYHQSYFPFGAQSDNVAMAPNGNIYFDPKGTLYEPDFSKGDIHSRALMIHEMTHVWQHQNSVDLLLRGMVERAHRYLPINREGFQRL